MDNLINKARDYAIHAHARINQLRKYTRQPYDIHLGAVAELVASVTNDQAMIAAAWLHDTVEDTPATFEDLEREFGADVANLVKDLTDVSKPGDGNRAARKAIDRQHTALASPRAKTIKLADIIDNCRDICSHDAKFGRVYLYEAQALLEVLTEGDETLHSQASELISSAHKELGLIPAATCEQEIQPHDERKNRISASGRRGIRLFMEAFAARDIQEPLLSFDFETIHRITPGEWPWPSLEIAGVRENGRVTGYLTRTDIAENSSGQIRIIDRRQVVVLEASFMDVIQVLTLFMYCFVELDGITVGVIGRGDIEKPAVKMWLFGIIILIEGQIVKIIRERWPQGNWVDCISEGRLEKARQIQAERIRRGYGADLLDCLQFSDKMQICLHNQAFVESLGFDSTSAAKRVLKDLEALRNNLAHGQDVTRHDWPQIVRLARRIQQAFES